MFPEFHPAAFDVDVCVVESVFTQVTVVPAATLSSAGMKALVPRNSAPAGIVTDDDGSPCVGVGDGEAGDGAE